MNSAAGGFALTGNQRRVLAERGPWFAVAAEVSRNHSESNRDVWTGMPSSTSSCLDRGSVARNPNNENEIGSRTGLDIVVTLPQLRPR